MKKYTRGFTLIELLVVVAIIGILSSVVLVSLNTARGKGKDSHVLADVNGMRTGLEAAYNGSNYNAFFTQTNRIGSPQLFDSNMVTTYADAVSYAPATFNTNPTNGVGTWVDTAANWAVNGIPNYPIIISSNTTIPITGNSYTLTSYAIYGRLSTGVYFCIDSTGKTNPAVPAVAANFTLTCPN